ncbi:MAG: hypothetical protein LBB90_00020 [Tannerella sp.]|nr:hypothetical protein [Tannerella sp.]
MAYFRAYSTSSGSKNAGNIQANTEQIQANVHRIRLLFEWQSEVIINH